VKTNEKVLRRALEMAINDILTDDTTFCCHCRIGVKCGGKNCQKKTAKYFIRRAKAEIKGERK